MPKNQYRKKQIHRAKRVRYEFLSKLKRASSPFEMGLLPDSLRPMLNHFIIFENGYRMSVQCGWNCYSTPKKNLKNLTKYKAFEVACFDNRDNWIVVKLMDWGESWKRKYDGYIPEDALSGKDEGHFIAQDSSGTAPMPYLLIDDVELIYKYLKSQKRKFVIIEKHK